MMRYAISAIMMALCMCGAAAAADQNLRLAVLASDDKQSQAIMALVEVSLSMRDDVEIIDRSHIDKILAEHRLQNQNMVSNADRLSTARLLGCDVFADIRAFGTGEERTLIMRALDARTGARLIDVSVDLGLSLEEQAESVSVAIYDALQKVKSGEEGNGVPVSIGDIREVGLPLAYRHLPEVVKPLLERYLLMSPTISVLERERLGLLNREAEIAEDTRSQLLASAVVIDVDVSTTMEGRLRLRASMSKFDGKEVAHATVEGEWAAYGSALLELVQSITRSLNTYDVAVSCEALYREAERYFASDVEVAVALGEAAFAREPSNDVFQKRLIVFYSSLLHEYVKEQNSASSSSQKYLKLVSV